MTINDLAVLVARARGLGTPVPRDTIKQTLLRLVPSKTQAIETLRLPPEVTGPLSIRVPRGLRAKLRA